MDHVVPEQLAGRTCNTCKQGVSRHKYLFECIYCRVSVCPDCICGHEPAHDRYLIFLRLLLPPKPTFSNGPTENAITAKAPSQVKRKAVPIASNLGTSSQSPSLHRISRASSVVESIVPTSVRADAPVARAFSYSEHALPSQSPQNPPPVLLRSLSESPALHRPPAQSPAAQSGPSTCFRPSPPVHTLSDPLPVAQVPFIQHELAQQPQRGINPSQVSLIQQQVMGPNQLPQTQQRAMGPNQLPQTQQRAIGPNQLPQTQQQAIGPNQLPQTQQRAIGPNQLPQTQQRAMNPNQVPMTQQRAMNTNQAPQTQQRVMNPNQVSRTQQRAMNPNQVSQTQQRAMGPNQLPQTQQRAMNPNQLLQTQQRAMNPNQLLQTQQRAMNPNQLLQTQQRAMNPNQLPQPRQKQSATKRQSMSAILSTTTSTASKLAKNRWVKAGAKMGANMVLRAVIGDAAGGLITASANNSNGDDDGDNSGNNGNDQSQEISCDTVPEEADPDPELVASDDQTLNQGDIGVYDANGEGAVGGNDFSSGVDGGFDYTGSAAVDQYGTSDLGGDSLAYGPDTANTLSPYQQQSFDGGFGGYDYAQSGVETYDPTTQGQPYDPNMQLQQLNTLDYTQASLTAQSTQQEYAAAAQSSVDSAIATSNDFTQSCDEQVAVDTATSGLAAQDDVPIPTWNDSTGSGDGVVNGDGYDDPSTLDDVPTPTWNDSTESGDGVPSGYGYEDPSTLGDEPIPTWNDSTESGDGVTSGYEYDDPTTLDDEPIPTWNDSTESGNGVASGYEYDDPSALDE